MHLIVAAGGGERDYAVDGRILTGLRQAADPGAFLNERLMATCGRPCSSRNSPTSSPATSPSCTASPARPAPSWARQAGVDAVRVAAARIASGQNDIFLVGGSYNASGPMCS